MAKQKRNRSAGEKVAAGVGAAGVATATGASVGEVFADERAQRINREARGRYSRYSSKVRSKVDREAKLVEARLRNKAGVPGMYGAIDGLAAYSRGDHIPSHAHGSIPTHAHREMSEIAESRVKSEARIHDAVRRGAAEREFKLMKPADQYLLSRYRDAAKFNKPLKALKFGGVGVGLIGAGGTFALQQRNKRK